MKAPHVSWNDCKSYDPNRTIQSAEQIHQEQTRNSEILELDYLHELNEVWLADQERAYVEKREDAVRMHQNKMALMKEDFRSRFWTLELECTSKVCQLGLDGEQYTIHLHGYVLATYY